MVGKSQQRKRIHASSVHIRHVINITTSKSQSTLCHDAAEPYGATAHSLRHRDKVFISGTSRQPRPSKASVCWLKWKKAKKRLRNEQPAKPGTRLRKVHDVVRSSAFNQAQPTCPAQCRVDAGGARAPCGRASEFAVLGDNLVIHVLRKKRFGDI